MFKKIVFLFFIIIPSIVFAGSKTKMADVAIPGLGGVTVGLYSVSNSDGTNYLYGRLGINQQAGPVYFNDIGVVVSLFEFKLGIRMQVELFNQGFVVETFRESETLELKEEEKKKKTKTSKEVKSITATAHDNTTETAKAAPLALCPPNDPVCGQMTSKKELAKLVPLDSDGKDISKKTNEKNDTNKAEEPKEFTIKTLKLKTFFVNRDGSSNGIDFFKRVSIDSFAFTLDRDQSYKVIGLTVGMSFFGAADNGAAASLRDAYENAKDDYELASDMYDIACSIYDDDATDENAQDKSSAEKDKNTTKSAFDKAKSDLDTAESKKIVMRAIASVDQKQSNKDEVQELLVAVDSSLETKTLTKQAEFFIAKTVIKSIPMNFFSSDLPEDIGNIALNDLQMQYIVEDKKTDKTSKNRALYFKGTIDLGSFDVLKSGSFECQAFYSPLHDFALSAGITNLKISGVPLPDTVTFKVRRQQDSDVKDIDPKTKKPIQPKRDVAGKLPYIYTLESSIKLNQFFSGIDDTISATLSAQFIGKKLSEFKAEGPKQLNLGHGIELNDIQLVFSKNIKNQWTQNFGGTLVIDALKELGMKSLTVPAQFSVDEHKKITFETNISLGTLDLKIDGASIAKLQDMTLGYKKDDDGNTFNIKGKLSLFGLNLPAYVEAAKTTGTKASCIVISDEVDAKDLPKGLKWIENLKFVVASEDTKVDGKQIQKGVGFVGTVDFSQAPMKEIGTIFGLNGQKMDVSGQMSGVDCFSLFIDLTSRNIDPEKVKNIDLGGLQLKVYSDLVKDSAGAGGKLDIYIRVDSKTVLRFNSELDCVLLPEPGVKMQGTLQSVGIHSATGSWNEPFGLKGLKVGPLGFYASVVPGDPIPASIGFLGRVEFGKNVGDIQLMLDMLNPVTNSGFKLYVDMSIGKIIEAAGTMVGVAMPTMPDIASGTLYMSYAPPMGLDFPGIEGISADGTSVESDQQKQHAALAAKNGIEPVGTLVDIATKAISSDANAPQLTKIATDQPKVVTALPQSKVAQAFPGLDTRPGHIPGGFYFYSSVDFLSLFRIDLCMAAAADPFNFKKIGVYGGAKVALSKKIQDLGVIKLKRGHDPQFPDNTQAIVEKYKTLPCLEAILGNKDNNSAALFFAFSAELRMFMMSAELSLNIPGVNFEIFKGNVFIEVLQDNGSHAIPEIDFYVEGSILEVLEAHVRFHEKNGSMSFDALIKNNLIEKLLDWTGELFDLLQKGIKEASKALDDAQKQIQKSESDVHNAFKVAQDKLNALKKVVAAIDDAEKVVDQFFGQSRKEVTDALNSLNMIIKQLDDRIKNIMHDLEHMNILDMLEMKPLLWTMEIVAFQIAKDMISIAQAMAQVSATLALDAMQLTAKGAMDVSKVTIDAVREVASATLDIAEFTTIAAMETARGVLIGTNFVMKEIASPVLKAVEEVIKETIKIFGGLFNIKLIHITSDKVEDLKCKVLIEMTILGQNIKLNFDLDLTRPDKIAQSIFEEIADAIKQAIVGVFESIAHI